MLHGIDAPQVTQLDIKLLDAKMFYTQIHARICMLYASGRFFGSELKKVLVNADMNMLN